MNGPVRYIPKHLNRFKTVACQCGCPPIWSVAKLIAPSGQIRFPWYCRQCGKLTNVYEPKHDYLIYTMVVDMTGDFQCERCGKMGAELHHWMPSAIAGRDADRWPKGYLCQSCHAEWHRIVTPNLSQKTFD